MHYVSDTRQEQLRHISGISRIDEDKYVWLDKFTIRNLELVGSSNEQAVTLLDVLDHTLTPMGGRLLKRWVMLPLKDIASIEERQDAVNYFLHHPDFSTIIAGHLKQVGDLERLISKVALGKISPREVNKGGVIREGVNSELDELRSIAYHGKDYLLKIQQREAERTGITSLKVGFNNVFGYFIEVTHTHKDKVPAEWTRKQTLTNAERYITEELKQ